MYETVFLYRYSLITIYFSVMSRSLFTTDNKKLLKSNYSQMIHVLGHDHISPLVSERKCLKVIFPPFYIRGR